MSPRSHTHSLYRPFFLLACLGGLWVPLACGEGGSDDGNTNSGDGDSVNGDGDGDGAGAGSGDGDGQRAGGGTADALGAEDCVGVMPLAEAGGAGGEAGGPCDNCAPDWELLDVQPESCGFGETYGLDSFRGHVTVVALLAGWCPYCQAQTERMEEMRLELREQGHDIKFVTINGASADSDEDRQNLIEKGKFPIFQDLPGGPAWAAHQGGKDHIFVYRADGELSASLPIDGELNTNLSTEEGKTNLLNAIEDAQ